MRCRIPLGIMSALLAAACSACTADGSGDGSDLENVESPLLPKMPTAHVVYHDPFMTIVSDVALNAAGVRKVAHDLRDAYAFDTAHQGWASPLLNRHMEVAVVTDRLMKKVTGQAGGGICWDADSFFTDTSIVSPKPADVAFEAFVAAHELEHMQMERLGATEPAVPVFAYEGIACTLGDWYVALKQPAGANEYLRGEARLITSLTSLDARDLFENFATSYGEPKKLYWYEHLGGFFFEFVRAHVCNNPDEVLLRWGTLTLAVASGTSFDQAFLDAYGTTVSDAQAKFVAFMAQTQTDPLTRLKGTVLEGFSAP